jgi:hypothetical protein
MKRIVLTFVAVGGLALMAASQALAANPICGKSYAMLMQGADPTTVQATGGAGNPGAVVNAVGVGSITISADCNTITGEMIYNAGDFNQTNNGAAQKGIYFGPAHCYTGESFLGKGIPCFDGGNHFSAGSVTNPGPNGNGSQTLSFTAGFDWNENVVAPGSAAFSFTVQSSTGGAIVVGTSVPPPSSQTANNAFPVLSLTMQKIGKNPVGTVFGAAPYLGNSVSNIGVYSANSSDFIASSQASSGNGVVGGFVSTTGALEIFSTGQAGGSTTFNSNDNIQATSGTATSSLDCPFDLFPGNQCDQALDSLCTGAGAPYAGFCTGAGTGTADCGTDTPVAYGFADGTANSIAGFSGSTANCNTSASTPGVGFALSSVQWGSTDTSSYFTVTSYTTGATGFTPGTGGEAAGTQYATSPAGKLKSNLTAAQTLKTTTTKSKVITITNATPVSCGISIATVGTLTNGGCTLSVQNGTTSAPGDTILSTVVGGAPQLTCTCTAAGTVSVTAQVTSNNCPVSIGGTAEGITCTF